MEKILTVLFPGFGYGPDKPLLHYAGKCAKACGFDTAAVNYSRLDMDESHSLEERTQNSIEGAVRDAMRIIREAGNYEKLFFVSKSFGTFAAGEAGRLLKEEGAEVYQIYLTPLPQTYQRYMCREECTAVTGTADPLMTEAAREQMRKDAGVDLLVIENGNHSLECPDDPLISVDMLKTVTEKIWDIFHETY